MSNAASETTPARGNRGATLGEFLSIRKGQSYDADLAGDSGPFLLGMGVFRPEGGFRHHRPRRYSGIVTSEGRVVPGDVLLATTDMGANIKILGRPARLPKSMGPYAVATGDVGRVAWRTEDDHARSYAYWVMRTQEFRDYCLRIAQGTTVRRIRLADVDAFPVLHPETSHLRDVVRLLDDLDRKLELNREQCETLEAIAQAVFKNWFVDFAPVRAKVAGHALSGMDVSTAALFSSAFDGDLPRGWKRITLAEVATLGGGDVQTGPFGSQLHASDYVTDGTPVVMPTNIRGRRVDATDIARIAPDDVARLSRHQLKTGDLVYSRRGDVEKHAIIGASEAGWLCGTGCLRVRLTTEGRAGISSHFVSLSLDQPASRAWIAARAVGATMPNLNTSILGEAPVILPPHGVLEAFDDAIRPLDAGIMLARTESQTLARLRNKLLSRLLSESTLTASDAARIAELVA